MLPFFTERFGNAASKQHAPGWEANDAVEQARKQVTALIGAGSKDVVFTSGATEANNLAIKGAAEARRGERDHLVTVVTERAQALRPERRRRAVRAAPFAFAQGRQGALLRQDYGGQARRATGGPD